jgi:hypothetical protein
VLTLRRFRDEQLAKSALGRTFIRVYYAVSPPMATYLEHATTLNRLCRRALDGLVRKIESAADHNEGQLTKRNS